jgi:hypothetical protein
MRKEFYIIAVPLVVLLVGCGPRQSRGFRLPEGDTEKGKEAFVVLQCQACHAIKDVQLPKATAPSEINVVLGGPVTKVKTYGELVTAVINPSHGIAPGFDEGTLKPGEGSPMPDYTSKMTFLPLPLDLLCPFLGKETGPQASPGIPKGSLPS